MYKHATATFESYRNFDKLYLQLEDTFRTLCWLFDTFGIIANLATGQESKGRTLTKRSYSIIPCVCTPCSPSSFTSNLAQRFPRSLRLVSKPGIYRSSTWFRMTSFCPGLFPSNEILLAGPPPPLLRIPFTDNFSFPLLLLVNDSRVRCRAPIRLFAYKLTCSSPKSY